MALNRRKFIQYSLASGGFVVSLSALPQKRADAFLFLLLSNSLMNVTLGALMQGAFALARAYASRRTEEWYEQRMNVQLAQREFLAREFTNVGVAETPEPQYGYVVAGQSLESLGHNVALGFTGKNNSDLAVFSGASSLGMAIAAQYLREQERMSPQDVQAAILPRYLQYNNWQTWAEQTSFTAYANVASQNGVLIRYDAVAPHSGGYGTIDVTVHTSRRISVPTIRVEYV